jgi:hypothetical protein
VRCSLRFVYFGFFFVTSIKSLGQYVNYIIHKYIRVKQLVRWKWEGLVGLMVIVVYTIKTRKANKLGIDRGIILT